MGEQTLETLGLQDRRADGVKNRIKQIGNELKEESGNQGRAYLHAKEEQAEKDEQCLQRQSWRHAQDKACGDAGRNLHGAGFGIEQFDKFKNLVKD